jgi:hypothetical protein
MVFVNEVSFAVSASCQELNGIDTAHVGFDDGDEVFPASELAQGKLCRPYPDGKPGTRMPMKRDGLLDQIVAEGTRHGKILLTQTVFGNQAVVNQIHRRRSIWCLI